MKHTIENVYWFTLTGLLTVSYIEKDGEIYISTNSTIAMVETFKRKLERLGIHRLSGLKPEGVLELLAILEKDIRLLDGLKQGRNRDVDGNKENLPFGTRVSDR